MDPLDRPTYGGGMATARVGGNDGNSPGNNARPRRGGSGNTRPGQQPGGRPPLAQNGEGVIGGAVPGLSAKRGYTETGVRALNDPRWSSSVVQAAEPTTLTCWKS